jgi:hypothetical protein
LLTSSRPSRSTISIAAGTALAAAAAATALTIGPASIARPAPRITAGRFGLPGDLGRSTGQGADPRSADPNRANPSGVDSNGAGQGGAAASESGYSTEVAAMLREQHAYQARAQAAINAAAVERARLAAHEALVLAEQEREPASQPPTTTQPTTAPPAATAPATAPSGSPQQIAMSMLTGFGWSSAEFSCLDPLWERESGWNPYADNPTSGAYGIPQALPGSKMASAGADWQSDAATQIRWGLGYIKASYGSPCGAWDHEESYGWY